MLEGFPSVEDSPMQAQIGGREYTYNPGGNMAVELFYRLQREGGFTASSLVNPSAYFQYFGPYLQNGTNILCFCFPPECSAPSRRHSSMLLYYSCE